MDRHLTNDECRQVISKTLCELDNNIPNEASKMDVMVIYSEIIRQLYHDLHIDIWSLSK